MNLVINDPQLSTAFSNLISAFNQVGTGAPPSEQACENFIQAAKKFMQIVQEQEIGGAGDNMKTIKDELAKFENWVDAGEPKA